jgi:hypothetical protein
MASEFPPPILTHGEGTAVLSMREEEREKEDTPGQVLKRGREEGREKEHIKNNSQEVLEEGTKNEMEKIL